MMKIKNILHNKQQGFALLEVMISALVLAVAVIAFVKLSNVSLKRAQENNNLSQATASANSLVEILRSNRSSAAWFSTNINGNFLIDATTLTAMNSYTTQCTLGGIGDNGTVDLANLASLCASDSTQLYQDLNNEILNTFAQNFQQIAGKAILCLRIDPTATLAAAGTSLEPFQVRIIVIWKYAGSGGFISAAATDCPVNFGDEIPAIDNIRNNTSPDRGYYELFTII